MKQPADSNQFFEEESSDFFKIYKENLKHLNLRNFKIKPCTIEEFHNHKQCPYYHGELDRRRNHLTVIYLSDFCQNEKCKETCALAHNKVERLYHIEKYKTRFCGISP